jgi:sarcosine oxidase, subunit beta
MKRSADIVVIGAGVVGASVASHLAGRGVSDVLLLERGDRQGLGSTGAATGGVRAQFETDINIKMSLYSLRFFREWEFDCEYEPAGYLFFATTDEQFSYLKQNVEKQRKLGVEGVRVVGSDEIREIVPILNCDDMVGGSLGASDGFINPLAVMRGFTESALSKGAQIEFGCTAVAIQVENGKVRGVETNLGVIDCGAVVICTGALARDLAATAGIDLPVEPQRRQIVWARPAEPLPERLPMVIDIGSGFHFRPAKDFAPSASSVALPGDVLFAYPDPGEGASANTVFEEEFIDKVYQRVRHRSPFLHACSVVREKCRAGLYENTPDHHAILGGCGVGGLYFANGFSGHGVMHSPATGRALAEIILDGSASFLDVTCLELARFERGELLHETAFI